jgi:hypothetical protein
VQEGEGGQGVGQQVHRRLGCGAVAGQAWARGAPPPATHAVRRGTTVTF